MPFDTTTIWTLKSFETGSENSLTLRFVNFQTRDGKTFYNAVGQGPVNGYGCLVEVLRDSKLIVSDLNQTLKASVDPQKNQLEQKLMRAIESINSYELRALELTLNYSGGKLIFAK